MKKKRKAKKAKPPLDADYSWHKPGLKELFDSIQPHNTVEIGVMALMLIAMDNLYWMQNFQREAINGKLELLHQSTMELRKQLQKTKGRKAK